LDHAQSRHGRHQVLSRIDDLQCSTLRDLEQTNISDVRMNVHAREKTIREEEDEEEEEDSSNLEQDTRRQFLPS
jgi:hypothetical protein